MKALFEILPDSIDAAKCILVCEIGKEGFSYAIKSEDQNRYVGIAIYEFEKGIDHKDQHNILQSVLNAQTLLSANFKKIYLMYSFPDSVLIPFALYSSLENQNVLNLVHGDVDTNAVVLTDLITECGIYNAYRVPADFINVFRSKFPAATDIHQYSVLLKQPQLKEDKLSVIFYPQRIVVKLCKKGQTVLVNSFKYATAEDVSYILLNADKQFDLENIPVEVSGLIEKDSALFKEIYKYFETITFASLPAACIYTESITQHPAHYFSHIFAIDACE